MLDITQLRELVIRPVLKEIGLWSPAAERLVLGTAIVESRLTFIKQLGGGPALGLWQVEPATHHDVWENYLRGRPDLARKILNACDVLTADADMFDVNEDVLVYNLRYGAAICRVLYWRIPAALPDVKDINGLAAYWKKYYNTIHGKGVASEFAAGIQYLTRDVGV